MVERFHFTLSIVTGHGGWWYDGTPTLEPSEDSESDGEDFTGADYCDFQMRIVPGSKEC